MPDQQEARATAVKQAAKDKAAILPVKPSPSSKEKDNSVEIKDAFGTSYDSPFDTVHTGSVGYSKLKANVREADLHQELAAVGRETINADETPFRVVFPTRDYTGDR